MSDDRRELADRLNRAARRAYDPRNAQTILQAATAIRDLAADRDAALAEVDRQARLATDYAVKAIEYKQEWEAAEAERDAALARADAAEASVRILAQGELDMTVRAVTAVAEAQRLREGIERHQRMYGSGLGWMADNDRDLWALLAEQPEGETK